MTDNTLARHSQRLRGGGYFTLHQPRFHKVVQFSSVERQYGFAAVTPYPLCVSAAVCRRNGEITVCRYELLSKSGATKTEELDAEMHHW